MFANPYKTSHLFSICPCSAKAITKDEMDAISDSSTQLLTSALRDLESQATKSLPAPKGHSGHFESDIASFLWSEASGDLLSDSAWVSVAQRDQQQQHSGLAMKTLALTPCVQTFCTSLDTKLRTRLDDLQHYLPTQEKGMHGSMLSENPPQKIYVTLDTLEQTHIPKAFQH